MVRITLASAAMGAAAWAMHGWLSARVFVGSSFVMQVLQVGVSIGAALVLLAVLARLLRLEEFDEAFGKIVRRLRPRRAPEVPRG
jgi:peptidoglycan biosynthesis protein MviN/MurJ (putative lipid II flippase)